MATINEVQDEIIEEFSMFDDWMDRYALLIELGNSLDKLDDKKRQKTILLLVAKAVYGCRQITSTVK